MFESNYSPTTPVLANSLEHIRNCHMLRMAKKIASTEDSALNQETLRLGRLVLDASRDLSFGGNVRGNDEIRKFQMVLQNTHREYCHRFEDQRRLLNGDTFLRRFGAPIARMPLVKVLHVYDRDAEDKSWILSLQYLLGGTEVLEKHMLYTMNLYATRTYGLGEPPTVSLLAKLPGSICKAGGTLLTDLKINISPPEFYSRLVPSEEEACALKSAIRGLKTVKRRVRDLKNASFWPAREQGEVDDLQKSFNAILSGGEIEELKLNFQFLWDVTTTPAFTLGAMITQWPWRKLRLIRIYQFPLRIEELQQFVENLDEDTDFHRSVTFSNMYLLSGTWVRRLEILHSKESIAWNSSFMLSSPLGGGCGDLSLSQYERVFGKENFGDGGLAEQYIHGYIDQNPLRDIGGFAVEVA